MPVYEFYCRDCHTVFNFFSPRVDTVTRPACPRCNRPELERRASLFAISKGLADDSDEVALPSNIDEDKMMQAFASLAGEFDQADEEDPKQAARMMRRLFDATGLTLGDGMAEALSRMEGGEDPDQIEADLGDILEQENPFAEAGSGLAKLKELRRELVAPRHDPNWYPLSERTPDGDR